MGSKAHGTDKSFVFGVISAVDSGLVAVGLTYAGLEARECLFICTQDVLADNSGKGKPWAAGVSARKARRHRRTRSGRVVAVPEGQPIPPEQRVTVGEVEVLVGREEAVDERTALLAGVNDGPAGGGAERATD
jgi:hypothetical protein